MTDKTNNYRIELVTGEVEDAGYRVYKASWQTHWNDKPIQRKKRNPRWKLVSVHEEERQAKDAIIKSCIESCGVKVISIDRFDIVLEFKYGARLTVSSEDVYTSLEYEFESADECLDKESQE